MRRWYFPSFSGDFRLIAVDESTFRSTAKSETACVLEVVEPTEAEREQLDRFLALASAKKWTAMERLAEKTERQEILLAAPMGDAGKELLQILKPGAGVITAVKSVGGRVIVEETPEVLKGDVVAEVPPEPKKEAETKAVSVARPTPSCPQCVPGAISRASEVLIDFLSPEEHATWAEHRYIVVCGGITGNRYVLAHRHSKLAARIGRICFDLDDECVVHFHDNSVPPEEEVLAAKLILEHREHWLRNEATLFGAITATMDDGSVYLTPITQPIYGPRLPRVRRRAPIVFKNPFGDITDGVPDARLTQEIGGFYMGFAATTSGLVL